MKFKLKLNFTVSVYDIYALLILLFPICFSIGGVFGYYDEAIGVISFVFVWYLMLTRKLDKNSWHIVVALTVVSVIGLISNLAGRLIEEPFPILVDLLWLWKTFAPFLASMYLTRKENLRRRVIKVLSFPAKLAILVFFCLALLGQVVNIGFPTSDSLFGLRLFSVAWLNGISFGWVVFCCILILALSDISSRSFFIYTALAFVPLILTSSALIYCFVFCVTPFREQDLRDWPCFPACQR